MQDDLIERLREAGRDRSGASISNGCVDCGLSANLCDDAIDRIAALEADNARLMGLVKEAGEAMEQAHNAANLILAPICASSGRYLYDWADCPDMIAELTSEGVKIPAKDFAELYDATNYRDDILAKLKEATDAD